MRRLRRIAFALVMVVIPIGLGLLAWSARAGERSPIPPRGRCGDLVKEKVDSRSLQHVFAGAPPPSFASDQPTSGPHSPVELVGVQSEPLSPVLQVGLLEEGNILLQHQGLNDDARRQLESLAGPDVIVAPGQNLPDTVLATAWTVKLRCDGVEASALRSFIARFQGKGPS